MPGYLGPAVTEGFLRRYQVRMDSKSIVTSLDVSAPGTARTDTSNDERVWVGRVHSTSSQDVRGLFSLPIARPNGPSCSYDDPTASSVTAHRQRKKAKVDSETVTPANGLEEGKEETTAEQNSEFQDVDMRTS